MEKWQVATYSMGRACGYSISRGLLRAHGLRRKVMEKSHGSRHMWEKKKKKTIPWGINR